MTNNNRELFKDEPSVRIELKEAKIRNLIRRGVLDKHGNPKKRTIVKPRKSYISFENARTYVRKLKINSFLEWREYVKKHRGELNSERIPLTPQISYKGTFTTFKDFLGTDVVKEDPKKVAKQKKTNQLIQKGMISADNLLMTYSELKDYVSTFRLKNKSEYLLFAKTDKRIPKQLKRAIEKKFGDKWISWDDFLSVHRVHIPNAQSQYYSFKEACNFVHGLNLKSKAEWKRWYKTNYVNYPHIPEYPESIYIDNWKDWEHFLGVDLKQKALLKLSKNPVIYVAKENNYNLPSNVYCLGLEGKGCMVAYDKLVIKRKADIIYLFEIEDPNEKNMMLVKNVMKACSTMYMYGYKIDHRIIYNIHELNWELMGICRLLENDFPEIMKKRLKDRNKLKITNKRDMSEEFEEMLLSL